MPLRRIPSSTACPISGRLLISPTRQRFSVVFIIYVLFCHLPLPFFIIRRLFFSLFIQN